MRVYTYDSQRYCVVIDPHLFYYMKSHIVLVRVTDKTIAEYNATVDTYTHSSVHMRSRDVSATSHLIRIWLRSMLRAAVRQQIC